MGQVSATAQDPTVATVQVRPSGVSSSADFYAEGNTFTGFEVYSVARFVLTKADFGLDSGDTINLLTSVEINFTHNDRSFTTGDLLELYFTTQNFNGTYTGLTYNVAIFDGVDATQFTNAPVSLGTFAYVPTAPGLFQYNYVVDLSAFEADIIAKINAGEEINIILGAADAANAITLAGLNNTFDPGDPTITVEVEAAADNSAPSVASTTPADGTVDVPTDTTLVIELDQFAAAGTGFINLRQVSDDGLVEAIDVNSGAVSIDGREISITPTSFLPELTEIYVEIGSAVITDEAGNGFNGTDASNFSFTTTIANSAPVFTETGPFTVSDNALAGAVVGDVDTNDDGFTDGESVYSILSVEDASNMAVGLNGFKATSIFTIGETVSGTTGALNPTTAGDYTPVGILDGMGAYKLDAATVRVLANHELLHFRGNSYEVSNGSGGTFSMTGARVSYFDIDIATRQIVDSGIAYNTVYDANGNVATDLSFQNDSLNGFSRFCSSALFEAEQFGSGRGLASRIYFTGEEDGSGFNLIGGAEWALDPATGNFWAVPAMGRGAWENVTEVDTGLTNYVAFILADDSSPFNADTSDPENEASPLYLYVGEKNPSGDFLEQNGLRDGKLYVWVATSGNTLPSQFNGAGSSEPGTWVEIDNSPNLAQASADGSTGFDEYGYPTQRNLWTQAEAAGAFGFSRPEDLAVNPVDGSEFVLASTGVDTYDIDLVSGNGADTFGTIYVGVVDFNVSGEPTAGNLTILYDGDEDTANRALRSPDNLDWADDGFIYVQEDEAEEDTASGDEVLFGAGAVNPNEAGIVQIDPATGDILRVANVDRSIVLDPSIANPLDAVDVDAGFAGEWESSGILDVSNLFGELPGTLFIFNVQAHGIEDQTNFNAASRIVDGDLVEGGQLLFLERKFDSMLEALGSNEAEAIFTIGETFAGTAGALNPNTAGDYTPVGILDGLGAYELDAQTVRVLANHELLHFRGNSYEVSNGSGGTFTMTGARVSYFDIDKSTLRIIDSGLAYNTIYDANGNVATDLSFQNDSLNGFSRFCSSSLFEPEQFGPGLGLVDRIYFTGEEDGSGFNLIGGAEWALDPATGNFWAVPAMGRGAWENVTQIDTGLTNYVAFILADDSSPFDADPNDPEDEASPLYLYVGEKNPAGDFLARNGLRDGKLYVWVADSGSRVPSEFNGAGAFEAGSWVEIDNSQNLGQASADGSTGFDEYGYPTQRNLWTQADAAGAFGFSRPEDLAVNPFDGFEFVLASTGVDTYDVDPVSGNGADTFGTIYVAQVEFDGSGEPIAGDLTILYDGDADPTRALRSPDNLDWADDGLIYVQEDEAEEDTLSGDEILFGPTAINPNEAGVVVIDPATGIVTRVANIDRSVIIDPTIANPLDAFDTDAGSAGEWESSGILDVSTLFGEQPGKLFILNVQAHGIEDQTNVNGASRINDNDLVEGGQLIFMSIDSAQPTLNFADAFEINPSTGVITLVNPSEIDSDRLKYIRFVVEADDGLNAPVTETVDIFINDDPIAEPAEIRVASFNTSLNRNAAGQLITDLSTPSNSQAQQIAEIIQRTNPDVILINEFDYDPNGTAIDLFKQNYLEIPQNGQAPVYYGYSYNGESNTGIASGFDLDNNGSVGGGGDAFGFGNFEGQFGFIVLSKYPIVEDQVRTFQKFLWKDMPGALLPADPLDSDGNFDVDNYYTTEELDVFRLSSKSHWDIPVWVNGEVIHALASHPTPPVFDGAEDRNGTRNHDEIRFWVDYVNNAAYIYDDFGQTGGLPLESAFVILGDQNADPFDGDSTAGAANQLVDGPWVNVSVTPSSLGGVEDSTNDGGSNLTHLGDPAFDTSDFGDPPGNLRVDYALPSSNLTINSAGVFWPEVGESGADLVSATDHRLVYVDLSTTLEVGSFVLAGDATVGIDATQGNLALILVKADGTAFDSTALDSLNPGSPALGEITVGTMIGDFMVAGYLEVGPNGTINVDGFGYDLQPGAAGSLISVGDQFGFLVFDNLLFESDGGTDLGTGSFDPFNLITDPAFIVQEGQQTHGDDIPTIFRGDFTLQILHASDLEGGVEAIKLAPNFAAIVDDLEDNNPADGTIILSAGDNYIPGPFFNAASDSALRGPLQAAYQELFATDLGGSAADLDNIREGRGRVDIAIMNIIEFNASAVGNHEFDVGSDAFEGIIEEDVRGSTLGDVRHLGAQFPYLSANLDFSGDNDLGNLFTSDILPSTDFALSPSQAIAGGNPPKLAPAAIVDVDGEPVGVVGATTQLLEQISSPDGTFVIGGSTVDMTVLAAQLQPVIDEVLWGLDGVPGTSDDVKIVIVVSHLQQIALELELAELLTDVDVIIAGGSDTLLADNNDALRPGDVADDTYPLVATDLDGNSTLIVSTDGEYSYVGRLIIEFGPSGTVNPAILDDTLNGPVATTDQSVIDLYGEANIADAIAASVKGTEVKELVDEVSGIVNALDGNVFGYTAFFIDGRRASIRTEETFMGNLTADANLWKARQTDSSVVISFKNGGGIRAEIGAIDGLTGDLLPPAPNADAGKPAGAISELDIQNTLRFNNGLVLLDLSGQDILEILEHGLSDSFEGNTPGEFPQIGGLQFAFTPPMAGNGGPDTPAEVRSFGLIDETGRVVEVLFKDGVFLNGADTREFKIVTLNFLAEDGSTIDGIGGDGYPFPALASNFVDLGIGEQQALQEFLAASFPTPELAFSEVERGPEQDPRIQNLEYRFDTIGTDIPVVPAGALRLTPVATYESGIFDESATEIVAFHAPTDRLFAVSSAPGESYVRVLDASDPVGSGLLQVDTIPAPLADFEPNSVDTFSGPLGDVVAIAWSDETGANGRGRVTLHDPATLASLAPAIVGGFLPDMLTFSPDGEKLVVANEGEADGGVNPVGSVSVITFGANYGAPTHNEITFDRWNRRENVLRARGVLLTQIDEGEAANVAEDLEPEYVAIDSNSQYAWVALQEANAVAVVDLVRLAIRNILPLGTENYSVTPLDPSDRDEGIDDEPINVQTWSGLYGLRQPDSIALVEFNGQNYLLTANEGDARDFEEDRFKDAILDPSIEGVFGPLQEDDKLGRLEVNLSASDLDNDGDVDVPMAYGGRSMTVFESPVVGRFRAVSGTSTNGNNDIEEYTASIFSTVFNSNNDDNDSLESRSDAKGAEPEALTVGEIDGVKYAFLGLERQSAIMVYDVTDPRSPQFHSYVSNRNFMVDADTAEAGDLGPEGIEFIPADVSPLGVPTIAVANEVSGTVTLYRIDFGL